MKKFTNGCVKMVNNWLPDAFIFCIILTVLAFLLAMPLTGQGPMAMVKHWGNGVWGLLAFSMEMALVAVLGSAFASAPIIKRVLTRLAAVPKSATGAIIMVTAVSVICCWLQWGFGLIVGAIFAKEIAKRRNDTDYRLLIASAYSGFVVWHAGLSGSIPLQITTINDAVVKNSGGVISEATGAIPLSETIMSGWNLIILLAILILMPIVNAKMHPSKEDVVLVDPSLLVDEETYTPPKGKKTPAQAMENTPVLSILILLLGVVYLVWYFVKGNSLSIDSVNLIFLMLGIAFHGTPIRYVKAIGEAAGGAAGVLLQFPFYAGIQGIMMGANPETGASLASVISNALVNISNNITFPVLAFLSAGIVNFFVPSGGSQWAVQGPIIMPAGVELGVKNGVSAMAIAWGDAWTNMIQPFWALPALAVAKLSARDIMGYCVVDLILSGIIIIVGFLIVGATGISAVPI